MENLLNMIKEELQLQGYQRAIRNGDMAKIAGALEKEGIDFGEIGVTAAVLGYLVGKGVL